MKKKLELHEVTLADDLKSGEIKSLPVSTMQQEHQLLDI